MCALLLGMKLVFAHLFAKILSSITPGWMPVGTMRSFTVVCLVSTDLPIRRTATSVVQVFFELFQAMRMNIEHWKWMAIRTWLSKQPCFFEYWFAKISLSFLHGLDFALYCYKYLLEWNGQLRKSLGISAFHSCNCHVTHKRIQSPHLPPTKSRTPFQFFSTKKDYD